MKCTKIGGSEIANARVTFAAGITYLFSGEDVIILEACSRGRRVLPSGCVE